jgi:uncharacterized membrane protein
MAENRDKESENENGGAPVSSRLLALLIIGFAFVIVGITVVLVASVLGGGSASFGGVIFIGPFPIVIGAGPDAMWLILIGVVIAVLSAIVFFLMIKRIEGIR